MQEFLWVERYRPHTVKDTILPVELKKVFQQFVDDKNLPNLILHGRAGIGKTTIAKAVLDEIGADYMVINGSMNGNIDTLRIDIAKFASAVSFSGGRKFVILDEADYLNPNSTQPALRNFMEEFSANCGFILTCNFIDRVIEPLHSRCGVIEFKIPREEKAQIAKEFFLRACNILTQEGIPFDKKAVAAVVQNYFPDWRRVLNELQRYSATGSIDEGILRNKSIDNIEALIEHMKAKNFTEVRKWIADNSDMDSAVLYRALYDILPTKVKSTSSVAALVVILAEHEYKEAFVVNSEINRAAAMAELMGEMDWK